MRRVLKWLLRSVLVVIVLFAALVAHTIWFKPVKIDWFYGRVFAEYALQSPELLSTLRILPSSLDFYSNKLDDASPAHELKLARMVKDNYAMLQRYDRGALDRPGQLSYDALGPRFKLSEFHDQVLTHGSLPLSLLESVINEWIARNRAQS